MNPLQILAADVEATVRKGVVATQVTSHGIFLPKDIVLEERIFDVACRVAIQLTPQLRSSNFHTWEFFRQIKTEEEARQNAPRFREATYPFATCLDMATEAARCLNAAIRQDANLAKYANCAKVVTDCKPGAITSARELHCLTMICFEDCCICIDLCAQPTAFKVKPGTAYESDIHSFTYAYVQGRERTRLLVDCTTYDSKPVDTFFAELTPFYEITKPVYEELIRFAIRAKLGRQTPLGELPSRKTIQARGILKGRPSNPFIDQVPLEGDNYITETLALRVDFVEQELLLAIPYGDWLLKPGNAYYLERLRGHSEFKCGINLTAHVTAHFHLRLGTELRVHLPLDGFKAQVLIKLQLMDDIWTVLGMPKGELLRTAYVVLDVWKKRIFPQEPQVAIAA
ncbi:hypothetical protein EK21DRAFT_52564 [Setomelanomma holmii]|uniref:Uncharacterized protein n=1 Tax=Setomelanomma holmii TaxID=210430 RepID=A0A9P4HMQ4_9PLEO|nr:hypothetical protein EK21DRAFT_52564 [Setomelanomma holmii]